MDILDKLAKSKFRSRFKLRAKELEYIRDKGLDKIRSHACDFIRDRVAPAEPVNDGKQTPMRGHPVFIAQHATATCCRGCIEKWHKFPKGREFKLSWIQTNFNQIVTNVDNILAKFFKITTY